MTDTAGHKDLCLTHWKGGNSDDFDDGLETYPIKVEGDAVYVGLCQYLAEFTTLVKYNMPVKVVVLNNNELGKITKEQRAGGWDKWATDLVNPDFSSYATSCGILR